MSSGQNENDNDNTNTNTSTSNDVNTIEPTKKINCSDQMVEIIKDLEKLSKIIKGLANDMKKVKRVHEKEVKKALKSKRKKDPNAPKREPTGFARPSLMSPELCKFLGVSEDTMMSHPEATKGINAYIKAHNLQNPANKREIFPDKKLAKLLSGPTDGTQLTFFNLQKYIKHHFIKPTIPVKPPVQKKD